MNTPIYISGPMTGIKDYNAKAFMKAEKYLRSLGFKKADIVNPVRLSKILNKTQENPTYWEYLMFDLKHLDKCNSIFMLPDWTKSRGASIEALHAEVEGIARYGAVL